MYVKLFNPELNPNPRHTGSKTGLRRLIEAYPLPIGSVKIEDNRYDSGETVYAGVDSYYEGKYGSVIETDKSEVPIELDGGRFKGNIKIVSVHLDPEYETDLPAYKVDELESEFVPKRTQTNHIILSYGGQKHADLCSLSRLDLEDLANNTLVVVEVSDLNLEASQMFKSDRTDLNPTNPIAERIGSIVKSEVQENQFLNIKNNDNEGLSDLKDEPETLRADKIGYNADIGETLQIRLDTDSNSRYLEEKCSVSVDNDKFETKLVSYNGSEIILSVKVVEEIEESTPLKIGLQDESSGLVDSVVISVESEDEQSVNKSSTVDKTGQEPSEPASDEAVISLQEPTYDINTQDVQFDNNGKPATPSEVRDLIVENEYYEDPLKITISNDKVDHTVEDTNAVGSLLEQSLVDVFDDLGIAYARGENSQLPPDYVLDDRVDDVNLLEIKAFSTSNGPRFDIGNFEAYCESLVHHPEILDSEYLIFEYEDLGNKVAIKNIYLKKVWEMAGYSSTNPMKLQIKRGNPYNIRPVTWYSDRSNYDTFGSKSLFLEHLYQSMLKSSRISTDNAERWRAEVNSTCQLTHG